MGVAHELQMRRIRTLEAFGELTERHDREDQLGIGVLLEPDAGEAPFPLASVRARGR